MRLRLLRLSHPAALALPLALAGCAEDPAANETASAVAAITAVPAGVRCVEVTATGSRVVTSRTAVSAGTGYTITLANVPTGAVTFTGAAYAVACTAVTASTAPTWVADPVAATLAGGSTYSLVLTLRQPASAAVSVNFTPDAGVTCVAGAADCNGAAADGCEVDLNNDPAHCGRCGFGCLPAANAAPACAAGACRLRCNPGYGDCDGDPANGCEAALATDPRHCNACGRACPAGPGATATCAAGACGLRCDEGRGDCDRVAANGCEASLIDTANCGACGVVCGAGLACLGGRCTACPASTTLCPRGARLICTPTSFDPDNCGACGRVCAGFPGALPACRDGACSFGGCLPGLANCDGDVDNGCERDVTSDPRNCGACGRVCPAPLHAVGTCRDGACGGEFVCEEGFVRAGAGCLAVPAPRPVAPPSTATVTSRRPTLRWALGPGADGAHVDICRDRACFATVATIEAVGTSGQPAADLPTGTLFWRLRGRSGAAVGASSSATWQFTVGARSAAVDAAGGTSPDFDGDGRADIFVGDPSDNSNQGAVFRFYGGRTVGDVFGSWSLHPTPYGARFGGLLASLGDVNGDGFADLAASSLGLESSPSSGRTYVFLGGPSFVAPNPATVLTATGAVAVASAGDANGDGFADLVAVDSGATRLHLGSAGGIAPAPSVTLPTGGNSVSAGDLNGDGFADLVVGAPQAGDGGSARIYLGSAAWSPTAPSTALTGLDSSDAFGTAVSVVGDVNGDGFADVVVVASGVGRGYLYFGNASGVPTPAGGSFYAATGATVAGAGDVDGDGLAEFVVGAPGGASVYHWNGTLPTMVANLTPPASAGPLFGASVSGVGDVNADGFADVVVGAPSADGAPGHAYVYFGSAAGLVTASPATLSFGTGTGFGAALARLDPRRVRRARDVGRRA